MVSRSSGMATVLNSQGESTLTLLDEFEKYYANDLSPRTITTYRFVLDRFLPTIRDPITIRARELALAFQRSIEGRSATQQNIYRAAIRKFFAWLVVVEYRTDDPAEKFPRIKAVVRKPTVISDETVKFLLMVKDDTPDEQRDHTIVLCMLDCGLRLNEVITLTLSDFRETELRVIGKGNKERFVPMSKRLKLAIEEWLGNRWLYRPKCDTLFIHNRGTGFAKSTIQLMIQHRGGTHPHALRRYFATKLANNGVDVTVIQELMGHESILTTQRYISLSRKRVHSEYARVIG